MGLGNFLRRADQAVQDTKGAVTMGVILSVAALVTAVVAFIIAIVRLDVEKLGVFMAQHPAVAALTVAALMAACGYHAYWIGYTGAKLNGVLSDSARVASEALGG